MNILLEVRQKGLRSISIVTIDSSIWLGFLVLFVTMSFTSGAYGNQAWLRNSALLFTLACVFSSWVALGGRCAILPLKASRWIIFFSLLGLVWLLFQWQLPISNSFYLTAFNLDNAPEWFKPQRGLSIVPEQTKWLFLSGVFELVLLVLAICLIDSRSRVKQLLCVLMLITAVHSILAIAAKFGGYYLVDVKQLDGHYSAARGLFVNRNHLAAMASLGLFAGLGFQLRRLLQSQNLRATRFYLAQLKGWNIVVVLLLTLGVVTILLSQSRAGFLAILLSLVLSFFFFLPSGKRTWWLKRTAPAVVLALIVLLIYFGQDLTQRLSREMLSIGERGQQWAITWQAIKQNIMFGYGGGSYQTVFQIWREYADFRFVIFDQSHNYYLHLWLEQGLVGLFLWCAMLYLVLSSVTRHFSSTRSTLIKGVQLAAFLVIVAASLQALVDFNLQIMNIRSYFFVIIALSLAAPHVRHLKLKSA